MSIRRNRNLMILRLEVFLFIIAFLITSCSQISNVAGKNFDENEAERPGLRSHMETFIDTNQEQYEIEVGTNISRETSLNLKQPIKPRFELNSAVEIKNVGDTLIENPYLIINGNGHWYDIDSMLAEILTDGMTDKEKAFAIWKFVTNHQTNANPAEDGDEIHDPVKYFNIYGYGVCDDVAKNLMLLWQAAGLEARLVALNGHVVSEVWFDGEFHVMDSYLQTFYLNHDNETLASSDQLAFDNYLVKRTHHLGPYTAENQIDNDFYASFYGADDFILSFDYESVHQMNLSLRPDESFTWKWDNIGKYHDNNPQNIEKAAPPYFANGKLTYTLDLSENTFRKFLVKEKNISTVSDDGKGPDIHLENAETDGHIVLHFEVPYIIVGGTIKADFRRPSTDDVIKMYISPDNINWQRLWMASDQQGRFSYEVSIDDWVAPLSSKAKYEYYLMVEFIGDNSRSKVGADYLSFETDVQMAPVSLPALEPGVNQVEYYDETEEPHQVMVTHKWVDNSYNQRPQPPEMPIFPEDGEHVRQSRFTFQWGEASDDDGDEIWGYQIFLSEREDMSLPFSTNFDQLVYFNEYKVPFDGLLKNDTRYYWRVRSLDENGLWSDWSDVWSFVPHVPGAPANLQFIDAYTIQWEADEQGTTPVEYEIYGSNQQGFFPSEEAYNGLGNMTDEKNVILYPGNLIDRIETTQIQVISEAPVNDNQNKYFYKVIAVDSQGVKSAPAFLSSPEQWIYTSANETAIVGEEYQYQPGLIYSVGSPSYGNVNSYTHEQDVLQYSLLSGPEWLVINEQSGLLSGVPPEAHQTTEVIIEVRNLATDEICQQVFTITSVN